MGACGRARGCGDANKLRHQGGDVACGRHGSRYHGLNLCVHVALRQAGKAALFQVLEVQGLRSRPCPAGRWSNHAAGARAFQLIVALSCRSPAPQPPAPARRPPHLPPTPVCHGSQRLLRARPGLRHASGGCYSVSIRSWWPERHLGGPGGGACFFGSHSCGPRPGPMARPGAALHAVLSRSGSLLAISKHTQQRERDRHPPA